VIDGRGDTCWLNSKGAPESPISPRLQDELFVAMTAVHKKLNNATNRPNKWEEAEFIMAIGRKLGYRSEESLCRNFKGGGV